MSPLATDLAAQHYQHLSSLTPDQRSALDRERLIQDAANRNGRDMDDIRAELFERLAATP
jgi:hypothetical protein